MDYSHIIGFIVSEIKQVANLNRGMDYSHITVIIGFIVSEIKQVANLNRGMDYSHITVTL